MPSDADLPAFHARALDATAPIVAGVPAARLDDASVCEGWSVRELLNHVVSGNWWVPELVSGQTIADVGDRLDGDLLGADHAAAYRASADAAAAAFQQAGGMERPVAVSYGPVPGAVYCGHRLIDVLVHGWDLARSTRQDATLDPDLVQACWEVVEPELEGFEASGAFGTRINVPADADPQTRLLAALGRRA